MAGEDFHLGADVRTSDGRDVGKLVHLLVGPDYGLRALVVKEDPSFSGHRFSPGSWLVNDEFIVPKEGVRSRRRDQTGRNLGGGAGGLRPPCSGSRGKGQSGP